MFHKIEQLERLIRAVENEIDKVQRELKEYSLFLKAYEYLGNYTERDLIVLKIYQKNLKLADLRIQLKKYESELYYNR